MIGRWHIGFVASSYSRTVLVHGPESILAERAIFRLITAAKAERNDAEIHKVGPKDLADGRFLELAGGSLLASDTILVVEDAQNLSAELVPQIVQVATENPDNLSLVIQHDGSVKNKGLVDKLKKAQVEVVEATAIKTWQLPAFAVAEAKSQRVTLDQQAAQALVGAIGTDARAIAAAIAQLASDTDSNQITVEIVTKYFAGRSEISGFAIADDVMNGRTTQAMEKLRWALDIGVAPVLLVAAIASNLRSMGKYLDLSRSSLPQPELAKRVGVPPWKLKDLRSQANAWTAGGIASSIKAVAKADGEVKGGSDPEFALENLVLTVTAARRR